MEWHATFGHAYQSLEIVGLLKADNLMAMKT